MFSGVKEIKDDWVNTYDIILMVIDLETNIIKATKKLFIDLDWYIDYKCSFIN